METTTLDVQRSVTVPTRRRILRSRQCSFPAQPTRDYLDFAALADRLGDDQPLERYARSTGFTAGQRRVAASTVEAQLLIRFLTTDESNWPNTGTWPEVARLECRGTTCARVADVTFEYVCGSGQHAHGSSATIFQHLAVLPRESYFQFNASRIHDNHLQSSTPTATFRIPVVVMPAVDGPHRLPGRVRC